MYPPGVLSEEDDEESTGTDISLTQSHTPAASDVSESDHGTSQALARVYSLGSLFYS